MERIEEYKKNVIKQYESLNEIYDELYYGVHATRGDDELFKTGSTHKLAFNSDNLEILVERAYEMGADFIKVSFFNNNTGQGAYKAFASRVWRKEQPNNSGLGSIHIQENSTLSPDEIKNQILHQIEFENLKKENAELKEKHKGLSGVDTENTDLRAKVRDLTDKLDKERNGFERFMKIGGAALKGAVQSGLPEKLGLPTEVVQGLTGITGGEPEEPADIPADSPEEEKITEIVAILATFPMDRLIEVEQLIS